MNTHPTRWTTEHQALLEFERLGAWRNTGLREELIRQRFHATTVEYAEVLRWILEQPQAEAYDPQLVHRLRRQRDQRRAARATDRLEVAR